MTHDVAGPSVASAGSHGLSEAEIDALEYVVVEGRIASMGDYGILRSLLVRVRPEWETNHDAAPAATARTDADRDRTDNAATRPGEGTGDTFWPIAKRETDSPQPVASTPPTNATPGEGSVRTGRTCHRCGGDGIQLTEVNTYGEATCGTCGGSGRLD